MRSRSLTVVLSVLLASPGAAMAQASARMAFDSARYAWEAGQYPDALERLERLLTGPHRDSLLAPIAGLTGELYRTRELAPDATDPRWSPDGRQVSIDSAHEGVRATYVVDVSRLL